MGEAVLDCVEVLLLRLESDISEILRPIAERAVSVQLSAAHLRDTGGVTSEPVESDQFWIKVAFGHESLDSSE